MNRIWQNFPTSVFKKGLFDGITSVQDVKGRGSFGVGEFHALNGELIAVDGDYYRAMADGEVKLAGDEALLALAIVSQFNAQHTLTLPKGCTQAAFAAFMNPLLPTKNTFYALRIDGSFDSVNVLALPEQKKPYPTFDAAWQTQRQFSLQVVQGSMIAFYTPSYMAEIGIPGYHFHFIAADRSAGGHVTGFQVVEASLQIERIDHFELAMPTTKDFEIASV